MTVKEFLYSKGIKRNGIYSTEFSMYYHTLLGLINISKLKKQKQRIQPWRFRKIIQDFRKNKWSI